MAHKRRAHNKFELQENYEPSGSEDEYSGKEKQLLQKFRKKEDYESEEEVQAFSDSADSNDINQDFDVADSDVEGQEQSDDDLPNSKAWGKDKRSYYATDYVDEDYGGFGNDEEAALMEEEEAKNIQKRLLEQLGDEDFSLSFLNKYQKTSSDVQESVVKSDLSTLSKGQKLQLLEKENPEFAGLINDFKNKLEVAKDVLQHVINLEKNGTLPSCSATKFVKAYYDLILNYCTNISYYLLLKSQKISILNHPVTKRLYQYRQMLNNMESIYLEIVKPQIDNILNAVNHKWEIDIKSQVDVINKAQKRKIDKITVDQSNASIKKVKPVNNSDVNNIRETDFFKNSQNLGILEKDGEGAVSEESELSSSDNDHPDHSKIKNEEELLKYPTLISDEIGAKREITYQIAKNKGLTPHRKKEQRNPRVKHKLKYRKAKIRRKGAVREPRTEITRYAGEASGIKANIKKGIKIK